MRGMLVPSARAANLFRVVWEISDPGLFFQNREQFLWLSLFRSVMSGIDMHHLVLYTGMFWLFFSSPSSSSMLSLLLLDCEVYS